MRDAQDRPVVFRQGPRLYLRPIEETDVPILIRFINDRNVTQFTSLSRPLSSDQERQWVQDAAKRSECTHLAVVLNDGRLIGTLGLDRIDRTNRTALSGTIIGEMECWDQGFGTEAKMLLLEYAFNTLNLRKVCSIVLAPNKRSLAALRKQGYTPEGVQKRQYYINGRYVDAHLFAIFKKDFRRVFATYSKQHGLKKPRR